jgi:CubicO group peptidase (beta-lactamase class C family)
MKTPFAFFPILLFTFPAPAQTGAPVAELQPVESRIQALATRYKLPGASLAIAYQGRLVYARGFGLADRERQIPVAPDTKFRIGSISKPITAATLFRLQEMGKLSLDDRVFDLLPQFQDSLGDARMRTITVRQLLNHSGGWDSEKNGDPLFPAHEHIVEAGASFPPTKKEVAEFWLKLPLDFAPGTKHAYSNFGYLLAGLVIEKVTGKSYGEAVQELTLTPVGWKGAKLGRSLLPLAGAECAETGEARYYDSGNEQVLSIFSEEPKMVPLPYGGFSLELAEAAGGWIATPMDLLRLMTGLDQSRIKLLNEESMRQFTARPPSERDPNTWYAQGIIVASIGSARVLAHNGGIPGAYALFASLGEISFAFLTNTDPGGDGDSEFEEDLLEALLEGLLQVTSWPSGDGFLPPPGA